MLLYVSYPSWISPEIIPGFPLLRWYGLMYVAANCREPRAVLPQ